MSAPTLDRSTESDAGALIAAAVVANVAVAAGIAIARDRPALLLVAIVAAPLLAVGAFSITRRPQRGVLLLAALLPYHGLRAVVPFPAGWKEALVVVVVAATFFAPAGARGEKGRPVPHWWPVLGAFFGLSLVSAVLVGGAQGLVGLKIGFFFTLTAVAVWRCPLDARERDRLVTILVVNGFVTSAFGLVQQLLGPDRLVDLGWEYNENIRFAGAYIRSFSTFNQSFPFALFVMLVILVALPCALEEPKRPRSQWFFASLPVLVLGLAASVTRAAWLGLAVGLVYLAATRARTLLTALAHVAVVVGVVLVLVSSYSSALFSTTSSEERFSVWTSNVSEIAAHPTGKGIGSTGAAAEKAAEVSGARSITSRRTGSAATEEEILQPDNYYFKTTFELGVLGLWVLAILLVTSFSATHAAARDLVGLDGALAAGVAASVAAAAAVSLVATYFEIFPMDAYFWLLLATVAACVHESR